MRWFTSDWHLGHANIIDFCDRPYRDVHHMSAELCANYLRCVAPDDEVYLLGDMAMGNLQVGLDTLERLPGKKFFIPGNHDKCWAARGKADKYRPLYEAAGLTVLGGQVGLALFAELGVELCHFPYFGTGKEHGYDDKFSGNRPDDEGDWLLCGHVHEAWKVKDRMINVGVDVWDYAPVSEAQIMEIIVSRSPELP